MVVTRRASEHDVEDLSVLLADAFVDDAMLTWTFPGDGVQERIRRNFEVLDRLAATRGWLWTVEGNAAVALWVPPGTGAEYEEVMAELGPEVATLTDDGGARFDSFWGWVEHHRPSEPHWYLDHLAVDPALRGHGLGVHLVRHGLNRAEEDGTGAFLVTSRPSNVAFYARRGFVLADEDDAPDGGPHLWFLRWERRVSWGRT
jgi:N-acetylglutamate synthase-like GNAT family acetyltransferase